MKTLIALIIVLTYFCAAQADMLIIAGQNTKIEKALNAITYCVEYENDSDICIKEDVIFIESAILMLDEDKDGQQSN